MAGTPHVVLDVETTVEGVGTGRSRRERERETDRQTERERETRTQIETERERDTHTHSLSHTHTHTHTQTKVGGRNLQLLKDLGSGVGAGAPEDPQLGEVHGQQRQARGRFMEFDLVRHGVLALETGNRCNTHIQLEQQFRFCTEAGHGRFKRCLFIPCNHKLNKQQV